MKYCNAVVRNLCSFCVFLFIIAIVRALLLIIFSLFPFPISSRMLFKLLFEFPFGCIELLSSGMHLLARCFELSIVNNILCFVPF